MTAAEMDGEIDWFVVFHGKGELRCEALFFQGIALFFEAGDVGLGGDGVTRAEIFVVKRKSHGERSGNR